MLLNDLQAYLRPRPVDAGGGRRPSVKKTVLMAFFCVDVGHDLLLVNVSLVGLVFVFDI